MKRILQLFPALLVTLGLSTILVQTITPTAMALDPAAQANKGLKASGDDGKTTLQGSIKTITNVLLFILGAISVIMIIVGGLNYTVSGGDSTKVSNAKNTILYAIVGVVVALLAYAIIGFVLQQFVK